MRNLTLAILFVGPTLVPTLAQAKTLQVGASRMYKQPSEVRNIVQPGDVVEIDGNATYTGGLVFDKAGTAASKITIRGIRVNGKRPVISGGGNTIEAQGNHYVFESLDITGGTNRCFYHHADDVTVRDSVIHDCPAQGLLGGDYDTGSLLLEYSEVHHCGGTTQNHQIYMSSDPEVYPGAVFRMQFNYVHDGNGGNNVKSRASRNEIYYNWIEGALYHELECIGSDGHPEGLVREDSDVVGNVFVKRNSFFVTRFGGDGTGQTNGRYRFVNNTVVVQGGGSAVFRLYDGIDSLEAHNNVFTSNNGGTVTIVREVEASWVSGSTTIAGKNNWIRSGAASVPSGFTGTINGTDPGFVALGDNDLRPKQGAALVDAGATSLSGPSGHAFPNPLAQPAYLPPTHAVMAPGTAQGRNTVGTIDIGAFELGGGGAPPPVVDAGTPTDGTPDAGTPGTPGSADMSTTPGTPGTPGGADMSTAPGTPGSPSADMSGTPGKGDSPAPSSGSGGSSGGCQIGGGGPASLGSMIALLLLAASLRRRARQRNA